MIEPLPKLICAWCLTVLRDGPADRQIRAQSLSVHRHVQRFVTWLYDHVDRGRAEGGRRCAAARRLGHDADDETLVHSEAEVERHARPLHARRRVLFLLH